MILTFLQENPKYVGLCTAVFSIPFCKMIDMLIKKNLMQYTFSFTRRPGLILSQTLTDFLLESLRQMNMTANNS